MQFDLLGKAVRRFRLPAVDYVNAPVIIIPVQEGDVNSRYFEITLYDDHGDMDLSIYSKAMLSGTTPSGIVLTSSKCEFSEDKKTVIVQFSGGFTAQAGRVACDILFTNTDNTVALTSQRFYVIVSESQSGKIITENEENYNELLSLLKEVGDLENNLTTAEDDRVKAETARVNAETARAAAETQRETDFQTAKGNCEDATQDANDAAQDVRDLLNALPCPTNKIDGDTTTAIGELRFIALED